MDFFDYSKISSEKRHETDKVDALLYGSSNAVKQYLNNYFSVGAAHEIKKVIFNDPATIIIWKDGGKTVVKTQGDDTYDPEKGLAMCLAKKYLGNKGNYYETFKAWLPEKKEKENDKPSDFIGEYFENGGIWHIPDWMNTKESYWRVCVTYLYDNEHVPIPNVNSILFVIRADRVDDLNIAFDKYCKTWHGRYDIKRVIAVEVIDTSWPKENLME